ncbi:unnamed protein product [Gadus morhua 'NCC']
MGPKRGHFQPFFLQLPSGYTCHYWLGTKSRAQGDWLRQTEETGWIHRGLLDLGPGLLLLNDNRAVTLVKTGLTLELEYRARLLWLPLKGAQ